MDDIAVYGKVVKCLQKMENNIGVTLRDEREGNQIPISEASVHRGNINASSSTKQKQENNIGVTVRDEREWNQIPISEASIQQGNINAPSSTKQKPKGFPPKTTPTKATLAQRRRQQMKKNHQEAGGEIIASKATLAQQKRRQREKQRDGLMVGEKRISGKITDESQLERDKSKQRDVASMFSSKEMIEASHQILTEGPGEVSTHLAETDLKVSQAATGVTATVPVLAHHIPVSRGLNQVCVTNSHTGDGESTRDIEFEKRYIRVGVGFAKSKGYRHHQTPIYRHHQTPAKVALAQRRRRQMKKNHQEAGGEIIASKATLAQRKRRLREKQTKGVTNLPTNDEVESGNLSVKRLRLSELMVGKNMISDEIAEESQLETDTSKQRDAASVFSSKEMIEASHQIRTKGSGEVLTHLVETDLKVSQAATAVRATVPGLVHHIPVSLGLNQVCVTNSHTGDYEPAHNIEFEKRYIQVGVGFAKPKGYRWASNMEDVCSSLIQTPIYRHHQTPAKVALAHRRRRQMKKNHQEAGGEIIASKATLAQRKRRQREKQTKGVTNLPTNDDVEPGNLSVKRLRLPELMVGEKRISDTFAEESQLETDTSNRRDAAASLFSSKEMIEASHQIRTAGSGEVLTHLVETDLKVSQAATGVKATVPVLVHHIPVSLGLNQVCVTNSHTGDDELARNIELEKRYIQVGVGFAKPKGYRWSSNMEDVCSSLIQTPIYRHHQTPAKVALAHRRRRQMKKYHQEAGGEIIASKATLAQRKRRQREKQAKGVINLPTNDEVVPGNLSVKRLRLPELMVGEKRISDAFAEESQLETDTSNRRDAAASVFSSKDMIEASHQIRTEGSGEVSTHLEETDLKVSLAATRLMVGEKRIRDEIADESHLETDTSKQRDVASVFISKEMIKASHRIRTEGSGEVSRHLEETDLKVSKAATGLMVGEKRISDEIAEESQLETDKSKQRDVASLFSSKEMIEASHRIRTEGSGEVSTHIEESDLRRFLKQQQLMVGEKWISDEIADESQLETDKSKRRDVASVFSPKEMIEVSHQIRTEGSGEVSTQLVKTDLKISQEATGVRAMVPVLVHHIPVSLGLNQACVNNSHTGDDEPACNIESKKRYIQVGVGHATWKGNRWDGNMEDVCSSVLQEPLISQRNSGHLKSYESSECGSTSRPLEEKDSMKVWKEMKQNGFLSSCRGRIPAPKPPTRKSNKEGPKKEMEFARRKQVDRFARVAAPSGLLNKLNPGIINHPRNRRQVHSIIEAFVRSEKLENSHACGGHPTSTAIGARQFSERKDHESMNDIHTNSLSLSQEDVVRKGCSKSLAQPIHCIPDKIVRDTVFSKWVSGLSSDSTMASAITSSLSNNDVENGTSLTNVSSVSLQGWKVVERLESELTVKAAAASIFAGDGPTLASPLI